MVVLLETQEIERNRRKISTVKLLVRLTSSSIVYDLHRRSSAEVAGAEAARSSSVHHIVSR